MVTEGLRNMLLLHSGVLQVSFKRNEQRMLILVSDMPHAIGATFLMAEETPLSLIRHAFDAMSGGGERVIRVIGTSPADQGRNHRRYSSRRGTVGRRNARLFVSYSRALFGAGGYYRRAGIF